MLLFTVAVFAFTSICNCARSKIRLRRIVVSAGRNESWLYELGADEVVVCSSVNLICPKAPDHRDGQALVSFATNNFDRLSNTRITFVHGGLHEWHQPSDIASRILSAWQSSEFVHLGKAWSQTCLSIRNTAWCGHFFLPFGIQCPERVCTYEGLQFVVDGAAFFKLGLVQWSGLERECSNPSQVLPCSFALEYMAQIVLGGPTILEAPFLLRLSRSLGRLFFT